MRNNVHLHATLIQMTSVIFISQHPTHTAILVATLILLAQVVFMPTIGSTASMAVGIFVL